MFLAPLPASAGRRSAARLVGDVILTSAGVFAAATASFAVIRQAETDPASALIAGAATTAAIALLVGLAIAVSRARTWDAEQAAATAARRLEALAAAAGEPVAVIRPDKRRTVATVTGGIEALTGHPRDRFVNGAMGIADLMGPEEARAIAQRLAEVRQGDRAYRITYELEHLSGAKRRVEETGVTVSHGRKGADETIAVLRDITERVRLEAALRRLESELRMLRDSSPIGVAYVDHQGSACGLNAAAVRLVGNVIGKPLFGVLEPIGVTWESDSLAKAASASPFPARLADGGSRQIVVLISAAPAGEGHRRPSVVFLVPLPESPAAATRTAAEAHPAAAVEAPAEAAAVTAAEPRTMAEPVAAVQAAAAASAAATADPTPVPPEEPPAKSFPDLLEAEFKRARRFGGVFGMVVVRLEWETLEGEAIDGIDAEEALAAVDDLCRQTVRDVDAVCRLDGRTFAILLPEAGSRTARSVAERLRRSVREIVIERDGRLIHPLPAAGATRLRNDDPAPTAILERARQAAERAEQRGGNQVVTD